MNLVKAILKNRYNDHYDDKVFWVASRIEQNDRILDIYIEDKYVAGFPEFCTNDLILPIESFRRKRNNFNFSKDMPNILVSSGSVLCVKGKILVTQRSLDAIHDPEAWTTPAGRCDHTVYETALKETMEEIQITDGRTGEQIYPDVCSEMYGSELSYFKTTLGINDSFDLMPYTVNSYFGKNLIESRSMWCWFDTANNTLEVRLLLTGFLEEDVHFSNPEFLTETKLADPSWLIQQKMVPALEKIIHSRR